jgi:hypothetical protein
MSNLTSAWPAESSYIVHAAEQTELNFSLFVGQQSPSDGAIGSKAPRKYYKFFSLVVPELSVDVRYSAGPWEV